jgi:hypothetical protein
MIPASVLAKLATLDLTAEQATEVAGLLKAVEGATAAGGEKTARQMRNARYYQARKRLRAPESKTPEPVLQASESISIKTPSQSPSRIRARASESLSKSFIDSDEEEYARDRLAEHDDHTAQRRRDPRQHHLALEHARGVTPVPGDHLLERRSPPAVPAMDARAYRSDWRDDRRGRARPAP